MVFSAPESLGSGGNIPREACIDGDRIYGAGRQESLVTGVEIRC